MTSLQEAIERVLIGRDNGIVCPCCGQYCKVYKRRLNSAMAVGLIWIVKHYQEHKRWISIHESPLIQGRRVGGDFAKLEHWGLIVASGNDDSSKRTSGEWAPTDAGIDFAYGKTQLPSHALIYSNTLLGFSDEYITIQQALGAKFDYAELMNS